MRCRYVTLFPSVHWLPRNLTSWTPFQLLFIELHESTSQLNIVDDVIRQLTAYQTIRTTITVFTWTWTIINVFTGTCTIITVYRDRNYCHFTRPCTIITLSTWTHHRYVAEGRQIHLTSTNRSSVKAHLNTHVPVALPFWRYSQNFLPISDLSHTSYIPPSSHLPVIR